MLKIFPVETDEDIEVARSLLEEYLASRVRPPREFSRIYEIFR